MKRTRSFLLACCCLISCAIIALAQESSDLFLRAYQDFQAGEKAERDASLRDALAKYQSAAKLLEQIVRDDPTWQPPVVEYRLKKTRENIERLGPQVASLPVVEEGPEGPLPQPDNLPLPPPAINTTQPLATGNKTPASGDTRMPPPNIVPGDGGGELALLRRQLAQAKIDNQRLQQRLERQSAELQAARVQVDRTKVTVVELKSQLAQAQEAVADASTRAALPARPTKEDPRLAELTSKISALEADNEVLEDENKRLFAKLEKASKYIEASDSARKILDEDRRKVAKQRDEAVSKSKKIKDNSAQIEKLVAEKADMEKKFAEEKKTLQEKLANATDSEKIEKLTAENKELTAKIAETEQKLNEALKKPEAAEAAFASLRSEINSLNDRLLEAQTQVSSRDDQIKAYAAQLDEASGELAKLKLNPQPTAEDKRIMAENDLLRGIILRQIKEQTTRDTARVELEKEIQKLQVKSEKLSEQLQILAKPAFQLTDAEKSLFREPTALLSEPTASSMDVTMAITQTPGGLPSEPKTPQGAESLPDATRDQVEEARKLFELGKYSDAEKLYQQIVDAAPENYFALSNLGVTQIQSRKLSAAEVVLKKAIAINPQDSFAATNLGIVYSKQGRFDEAIASLREAVSVDEKDHIAHNYLGVCLGEKGLKGEAEQNFKRSIEIRDDYADAHFNLAVLYATTEPPSMDLAREHYEKAVKAGATPDPSLERLINK